MRALRAESISFPFTTTKSFYFLLGEYIEMHQVGEKDWRDDELQKFIQKRIEEVIEKIKSRPTEELANELTKALWGILNHRSSEP